MSRKAEDFLISKGLDKKNPTVGGVFFQGIVELLDEYESKQCNIVNGVGRSEQLLAFAKWHAKEPFTREEHQDLSKRIERYLSQ